MRKKPPKQNGSQKKFLAEKVSLAAQEKAEHVAAEEMWVHYIQHYDIEGHLFLMDEGIRKIWPSGICRYFPPLAVSHIMLVSHVDLNKKLI